MLEPLNEFICDNCGEMIKKPSDGILEWLSKLDTTHGAYVGEDFKILHHYSTSPLKESNGIGCTVHYSKKGLSDAGLEMFVNENYGMGYLLSLLDPGNIHRKDYNIPLVKDIREYVEILRRLTIPHYEEARVYWTEASNDNFFNDDNEISAYSVSRLKELLDMYSQ